MYNFYIFYFYTFYDITDNLLRGTYIGCFTDHHSNRILYGHRYQSNDVNSPIFCVNLCSRAGYKFAGILNISLKLDSDHCRMINSLSEKSPSFYVCNCFRC